jgi:intergrase/recombinase
VLYYSGIRITEACYLGDNSVPFEDLGGFRRYAVGWARGNKRCDYAYLPVFVKPAPCEPDWNHFYATLPMLPKMLRKFFYRVAKRTALENRADPLIADFYQSRVSRFTVGERHYGELRSEADNLYPKVMASLNSIAGRG